jgi:flavin reductase (DIM6/NTAB) family NADH-FMN oxidoreductase RutF
MRRSDMTRPRSSSSPEKPAEHLVDRLDYPLWVVTASDGDHDSGCLAGFVTQCSIDPLRFLVCISTANFTYEVARGSSALGLHLLGEGQHALASLFGEETGDRVDKFAQCPWHRGRDGSPILEECAAWIEGRIIERHPLGDHMGALVSPSDGGPGNERGLFTLSQATGIKAGHPA